MFAFYAVDVLLWRYLCLNVLVCTTLNFELQRLQSEVDLQYKYLE